MPSLVAVTLVLGAAWLWLWRGGRVRKSTLKHAWARPVAPFLTAVSHGLATLRSGRAGLQLLGCSALVWALAVLNNLLLLRAFDLDLPWISGVVVLLILQVSVTLPTAPASLGVYEYLTIVALSIFGVAESTALSYGILLHVLVLIPTFIGGALFWERSLSIVQLMRGAEPVP